MKSKIWLIYLSAIFSVNLFSNVEASELLLKESLSNHVLPLQEKKYYSQASQDQFVYTILYDLLEKRDPGFYLEIGSEMPIFNNNTFFFEKNLGWTGMSLDIVNELKAIWASVRINPLIIEDALKADFASILRPFPPVIDYLSLDVDGNYDTVLERIPLSTYIFKVITIEHDFYRFGEVYRESERKILKSFGYHLLCPDVLCAPCDSVNGPVTCGSFEDWWIHPSVFPSVLFAELISLDLNGKNHSEIIKIIKSTLHSH